MSKNNLLRWMFVSLFAFAAVAFVGCKDDIEDVQVPELSIDPASAILNFDEKGGSKTVEVYSNCDWVITLSEDVSWVDIQPMSGSGNATLTVTTYEKDEADLKVGTRVQANFTLYHSEYGEWGKSKSTLTINQTYGGEPVVEETFYFNNFDKEAATQTYGSGESWPYLDQFEGWKNQTGTGVENVTYSFKGMSARNNSNSNGNYSDYKDASGVNNMFFGSSAYLQIEKIAISSTNVNLSFVGEKYLNGSDNLFMPEEFTITLSADGQNWSAPISYSQPEGAGRWNLGEADFTLPEGTTTLWVKFAASVASAYRIDDVKLMAGYGGQQITFDGGSVTPPTPGGEIPEGAVEVTVQEFLDAAEDDTIYVLTGEISRVVKEDWGNFDLTDETATVYIYGLLSPEGEEKVQFQAAGLKQGDTITLYGKRSSYNGEAQMANATYVSHTSGGGEQPGPGGDPVPGEGPYASDSPFVCTADSFSNPAGLGDTTIDGNAATGFKLGTGTSTGVYSATAGVAGDKYLNFYAVAWKNKTATLYVRVDGVQVGEFKLAANDGATGNPPFNALTPAATDHYSVELKGLTASSKIEFSTSANYAAESNEASGRAIVFGVKLTDEAIVPGGGEEPTPTPGEVVKGTVQEFLAAADTATTYELTGEITSVDNTIYGNFDLTDETGTVYIYGLLSPEGEAQKQWAAAGLKQGDTITIQGVYSEYNGEPQIKNAIYVSHTPGEGGGDEPLPPTPGEVTTIAEVLALGQGATIQSAVIEATVISNMDLNNLTSKKGLYVQDGTAGLQFYLAANHELKFGDKVKIDLSGAQIGNYNDAVQISGLALEKITTLSSGNTVEAKTVTMADFLANKYEGQYVAIEGVQVASADLAKTWVMDGSHTSIAIEDANGNSFAIFSSKYATYGTQTVAQGSGTIKGISSVSKGAMQLIFAQQSDYAGLTGARFEGGTVTPDPTPGEDGGDDTPVDPDATVAKMTFSEQGFANAESVDGVEIALDDVVTIVFAQGNANTAPTYYDSGSAIRMYQNGATLDVKAEGKTITSIELTFANSQYYLGADSGELSEEGAVRTWTGEASAVKFTATGTDKDHRAYVSAIKVTYK